MKSLKLCGAAMSLALLSGCGAYDVQSLRGIAAATGGNGFTQALTKEYRSLTLFEADKMMDWPDAYTFAAKGLAASRGENVLPETTDRWSLPAAKKTELNGARGKLIAALDGGGRTRLPDIAARAQVAYDCWVEQEEEAWQTADIAHCKALFDAMLAQLTQAPAPAQAIAPVAQRNFIVYFAWDSARIDRAGEAVIDQAAAEAKRTGSSRITVIGHADRSGAADYNVRLSLRRAEAVRSALATRGISPDRSSVTALGETEPAVPTADGVKEPRNRRVEVNIR